MKYYLIAGEASGDLHASNLMRALQQEDANAEFRFFGGDLMASCGGTLVKHYRDMAYMGFIPVLMNLDKVLANMRLCKGYCRIPSRCGYIDRLSGFQSENSQICETSFGYSGLLLYFS